MIFRYPLLSSPLTIGRLTVKNRIVMPPMVIYRASEEGLVTQAHIDHYRSAAGPGLMIVEGTAVLPEGRISRRQLGIFQDRQIGGLARIAEAIHAGGGVAAIQIHHAGAHGFETAGANRASRVVRTLARLARQQFMTSGLGRIRRAFGEAASRAVSAGFDVVEIHGAHGYLLSQFLSPAMNWRVGKYGGGLEGRRRLLLEVCEEVRTRVSGRALVTVRLGVADGYRRGLKLAEGLSTAELLERSGLLVLDISNGCGRWPSIKPDGSPFSDRLHLAGEAKRGLKVPIIGGGGIRRPDLAERALSERMADLISIGKGLLADPAWALKALEGRAEAIVPCRNCMACFFYSDSAKCPARRSRDAGRRATLGGFGRDRGSLDRP